MISRTATFIFLVLMFVVCFNGKCDKAAEAIYGASVGMGEAITIKRDIAQAGELSPETERDITQGMLDANSGLIQVAHTAECFTQFTSDVKENVLRSTDSTISALDNLQSQGALRIKSKKGKEQFNKQILYAKLSARGLRMALAFQPTTDGQSQPTEEQQRKLEELRALCRKAGAQLRQNESRLLDDLARLDGTNPQK